MALALLRGDAPVVITGAPEDWPRWVVLLPHVLTATGYVDPGRPAEYGDDCSWLLDRAAAHLQVHGHLAEARLLAERALSIAETAHGPNHSEVSIRLNNLATILRQLGDSRAALPLAERALTITETAHGPDHPTVGIRLSNLALIRRELGDLDGARDLAERALAVAEAAHDPDHPAVVARRWSLAAILRDIDAGSVS